MAIIEVEKYKSIVPLLLRSKDIWTHYDDGADVLYMHFKKPNIAEDSELIDDDTIVRYDAKGEIIGLTFLYRRVCRAPDRGFLQPASICRSRKRRSRP